MKAHYIFFAIIALAISACVRNTEPSEPEGMQMTFTAYQEGSEITRTTVQEGGTQVFWEPADEIKVFFNGSSGRFVSQNTENATVATFTGTLNVIVGATEGAGYSTQTWGLYPYRADAVLDGNAMVTTLPASQTGRAGSFAKNTNITVAQSNGYGLAFYNVCGGLRFSLTQEGIKRVTFEGNSGEAIAGKIKVAFADGIPVVQEVSEGESVITLTAPGGGTFQTGQWYYISAIPGSLSGGYKMVFYKESESAKLTSSSSVTFKRGIFGSLADVDKDLMFKPSGSGEEPDPDDFIQFADDKVKTKLVAAFDTNGDGELSYAEAAAVTSGDAVKSAFGAIKTYKSFDEFQYFSNVESVPAGMFMDWNLFSSIVLPSSIKSIGASAFQGCVNLVLNDIPVGVTSIEESAFRDCRSITSVVIPSGVYAINAYTFCGCSKLSTIKISDGVSYIYGGAFMDCTSLTDLILPNSVYRLKSYQKKAQLLPENADGPFRGCSSLRHITLSESIEEIPWSSFSNCISLTSIELPSGIKKIGCGAFYGCSSLISVTIPEGLNSIDLYAFYGCSNLIDIVIPEQISSIGEYAFCGCESLTSSIVIPERMSRVEQCTFSGCSSLISVTIPESITKIGNSAFSDCSSLTTISIPESVTSIGEGAFSGCRGLTNIVIPPSVTSISNYTFQSCTGLTSITIPNTVLSIGRKAFAECSSLVSISIPEGVTIIDYRTFDNCSSLLEVLIPNGVTSIGNFAFTNCSSLTSLTIPQNVTSIGQSAFYRCVSLAYIRVYPETPPFGDQDMLDETNNCPIYVPANSLEAYKSDWSKYSSRIQAIED